MWFVTGFFVYLVFFFLQTLSKSRRQNFVSRGGVGVCCQTGHKGASSVSSFLLSCCGDLNSSDTGSLTVHRSRPQIPQRWFFWSEITSATHRGRSLGFLRTNEPLRVLPALPASCWQSGGSGFGLNAIGHTFLRLQEAAIVKIRARSCWTG